MRHNANIVTLEQVTPPGPGAPYFVRHILHAPASWVASASYTDNPSPALIIADKKNIHCCDDPDMVIFWSPNSILQW